MLLKTILNKCHKFKSFVLGKTEFFEYDGLDAIGVELFPRKNSKAICSCCHSPATLYDSLDFRFFEHIPIWGFRVFFKYLMRRVDCKNCGVKVEEVPWGSGKRELTKTYMHYLSTWARSLSWKEVAVRFGTSWEKVFHSVQYIVNWGLKNRILSGIQAIGIDEILWHRGQKYLTLVYQIDSELIRLLWIGKERTENTLRQFFRFLGKERSAALKFVCTDMWQPYLNVVKEKAEQALLILDRFHIVSALNKAIDKVRAGEHRQMQEDGHEPILKNSRWCLLKRKENLTEKQEEKLKDLLK